MQRNYHSATASTRNFPLVTSGHRFPRFPRFPGFPCLVHLIGDWEFHLPRPSPSSQILRSDHGSTSHKLFDLFLFIIYIYLSIYVLFLRISITLIVLAGLMKTTCNGDTEQPCHARPGIHELRQIPGPLKNQKQRSILWIFSKDLYGSLRYIFQWFSMSSLFARE